MTQDSLERLYLLAGLGTTEPPDELGKVAKVREMWACLLRLKPK